MKVKSHPWDQLDGPIFYSVPAKERKAYVEPMMWVMSFLLIALGIWRKIWLSTILGILEILSLLMDKEIVVTSRGLESYNQMWITDNHEIWPWEEISSVTFETFTDQRNKICLYFTKGDRSRKLFFKRKDWGPIQKLAKEKNPPITIYDGNEFKKQMADNAKKNKKKKKKKKKKK